LVPDTAEAASTSTEVDGREHGSAVKRLMLRLGITLAAVSVLMIPWPGLHRAYGSWFRATGAVALYMCGVEGLSMEVERSKPQFDTNIQYTERDTGWALNMDSRTTGYFPLALFIALWIGTPIPRRARKKTLLWGLLWVHVFILAQIAIILLWRFTVHVAEVPGHDHLAMFGQRWWHFVGRTLYEMVPGITARSVVPILIWAGVAARREYWEPEAVEST
jgi:hypothetical protein